jgi:radical SAM-linked protein
MGASLQRLRLTFSKGENVRYISHLDLLHTWERALRRANIPLAYSQGFHPHPKIVFAAALPVGCTGEAEVMDVYLSQAMPPRRVLRGLAHCLPDGLTAVDATPVYERAPALPVVLCGADYDVGIETHQPIKAARNECQALMSRDTIPRVYRGKGYDLRPRVEKLEIFRINARHLLLSMQLAAGQRGTGRPDEVLAELGWVDLPYSCHRRRLRFAGGCDA